MWTLIAQVVPRWRHCQPHDIHSQVQG